MAGDGKTTRVTVDVTGTNRTFYNALWSQTRLTRPEKFNTWPLIAELLATSSARLEIGPGLRPRLPIAGTHFIDLSPAVVQRLNASGGLARQGTLTALPFEDASFDLVCAFDVIEHVEDDLAAFRELSRVLKPNGVLVFSVPLHADQWTEFDAFVGHVRRYDPSQLLVTLLEHRLIPEKSALFGMQPKSPRLLALGVWMLTHKRSSALFWYNLFLPISILLQKRLTLCPGVPQAGDMAEILLVCRRGGGAPEVGGNVRELKRLIESSPEV